MKIKLLLVCIALSAVFIVNTDTPNTVRNMPKFDLNEKNLVQQLDTETDQCEFNEAMPVDEASVYRYELYAKYPQITLKYSPRFKLYGYTSDTKYCYGYHVTFLSEKSGEIRYEELKKATEETIENLKNKSDKEKATEVKQWIRSNCKYTKKVNNMWDESLYGCLVKGNATCLGYSQAMYYMMSELNVPCRIVTSKYHAWNEVFIDGEWVKYDVTWG